MFSNPHRSHIKPIYSKFKKQLSLFQAIDSLKLVALIDGFDSNIKILNEVLEFSQLTLAMYLGFPLLRPHSHTRPHSPSSNK